MLDTTRTRATRKGFAYEYTLIQAIGSINCQQLRAVFATGQSIHPEPEPGWMAVCRPVRSFSKVARQISIKDEDGRYSVVPSRLFWNLAHTSE